MMWRKIMTQKNRIIQLVFMLWMLEVVILALFCPLVSKKHQRIFCPGWMWQDSICADCLNGAMHGE